MFCTPSPSLPAAFSRPLTLDSIDAGTEFIRRGQVTAMRRWKHALAFSTALLTAGCMTVQTTQPGAVGVDRSQSFLVSAEDVQTASAESYRQTLTEGRAKGAINNKPQALNRVRAIANRLIAQVGVFRQDASMWQWEINVMDTPEVNAWCMAGGKIMVYTGLIDKTNPSDAELAAVLGHEIAHALREHTREAVSRQYGSQLALTGLGALTGARDRKSTRLNSSHVSESRMPSSA